jgi:hypothetical protein
VGSSAEMSMSCSLSYWGSSSSSSALRMVSPKAVLEKATENDSV